MTVLRIKSGAGGTTWEEVGGTGPQGPAGPTGATGPGVPAGGTTGQVLAKTSATDYATEWQTPTGGGGGGTTAPIWVVVS